MQYTLRFTDRQSILNIIINLNMNVGLTHRKAMVNEFYVNLEFKSYTNVRYIITLIIG